MAKIRLKRPADTYITKSSILGEHGLFATRLIKRYRYLGIYPGITKYGDDLIDESPSIKLFQIASGM
jgi:hypothetical protein